MNRFDKPYRLVQTYDQKKVIEIFKLHNSKKRDCHPYLWAILMLLNFNRKNLTN